MLGTVRISIPLTIAKITAIKDLAYLESMMLKGWQQYMMTYITLDIIDGNCRLSGVLMGALTSYKFVLIALKLLQATTTSC